MPVHCWISPTLHTGAFRGPITSSLLISPHFKDPSKPFVCHHIPPTTLADIRWWCDQLSLEWCGCQIVAPPDPLDISTFVDASTAFGIGFLSDDKWLAWHLTNGWNSDGQDIGWAEMVAIDLALCTFTHSGFRDCHLVVFSDNQDVVGALSLGRSCRICQNEVLHHIISNFREYNI